MKAQLTADDLIEIAKTQKKLGRLFYDKDGNYKDVAAYIQRIEVLQPDGTDVIGHFILEDGWVSFEFGVDKT